MSSVSYRLPFLLSRHPVSFVLDDTTSAQRQRTKHDCVPQLPARSRYDLVDGTIPDPYVRSRLRPNSTRAYHPDTPSSYSSISPPQSSKVLPPYATIQPSFGDSPLLWLSLYFLFNLSLTLYNKTLLLRFPFPYSLTALHTFCGALGTFGMLFYQQRWIRKRGTVKTKRIWNARFDWEALTGIPKLEARELVVLFLFSVLYTINIAVSNISLKLVTVPFHQVVRASSPFFTILCSFLLLGTRSTKAKLVSLIPVVAGVGFATYGDYYFTPSGFILTVLGTILAAFKTSSSPVQKSTYPKLNLTPIHLLALLSPLACIQSLFLAYISGELQRAREQVVSLANVKQVLTILCAVMMFNLTITPMNGLGIVLTLVGGMWYAKVEMKERRGKGEEEVKLYFGHAVDNYTGKPR
ncbi:hypothetical protein BDQ17DRAFT_1321889 [Cyathus striatus]|nr:hypothetical protein BDQ17DRAFT_1321889 [Cyathus striatus]